MVETTKGAIDPKTPAKVAGKNDAAPKTEPKSAPKADAKGTESTGMFAPNPIPDAIEIAKADAKVTPVEPEYKPEFKDKSRGVSIRLDDSTWDRVLQAAGSSARTTDEVIKDIIENALGVGSPSTTHHGG